MKMNEYDSSVEIEVTDTNSYVIITFFYFVCFFVFGNYYQSLCFLEIKKSMTIITSAKLRWAHQDHYFMRGCMIFFTTVIHFFLRTTNPSAKDSLSPTNPPTTSSVLYFKAFQTWCGGGDWTINLNDVIVSLAVGIFFWVI
jgi:hypothetical protein